MHPAPPGGGVCDCCADQESCDTDGYLDAALKTTGNYSSSEGTGDGQDIVAEISNGRPVGLRIQWPLGGGHFIGVSWAGQESDGQIYFATTDPIYKTGSYAVSAMQSGQYGENTDGTPLNGTWTDTYFTTTSQ
jgi:hypothetical protein